MEFQPDSLLLSYYSSLKDLTHHAHYYHSSCLYCDGYDLSSCIVNINCHVVSEMDRDKGQRRQRHCHQSTHLALYLAGKGHSLEYTWSWIGTRLGHDRL